MATASDRAAIAQIMATVARLTMKLATVNAKLVVALQKNLDSRDGHGGCDRTIRGRGAGTRAISGTGTGAGAPEITGTGAPAMSEEK